MSKNTITILFLNNILFLKLIETIIYDPHILNASLISCDGFGNIKEVQSFYTNDSDHFYNYIDHYYTKSTEEFVNKLLKGSIAHGFNDIFMKKRIDNYFMLNDITLDKII